MSSTYFHIIHIGETDSEIKKKRKNNLLISNISIKIFTTSAQVCNSNFTASMCDNY